MPAFEPKTSRPAYFQFGFGPKVVMLLHGYGQEPKIFLPLLAPFVRTHCFILPSLPGMGASRLAERHRGQDLFTEMEEMLERLLDHLSLAAFDLVGFSIGAFLGLHWLQRQRPEGLRSYTHIDHTPYTDPEWEGGFPRALIGEIRSLLADPENCKHACQEITDQSLRTRHAYVNCLKQLSYHGLSFTGSRWTTDMIFAVPALRRQYENFVRWPWAYDILKAYGGNTHDLRDKLSSIDLPMSLIYGTQSLMCPRAAVERMRSQISNLQVLPVGGAGHDLMLRSPLAFVKALRTALQ